MLPRNKSLVLNSLWRLLLAASQMIFQGAFVAVYTIFMTKDDYGLYGAAITLSNMFQLVAVFGLREAIVRLLAFARGANQQERMRSYIRRGLHLSLSFSLGASTLMLLLGPWLAGYLEQGDEWFRLLLLLAWITCALGIGGFLQGIIEGVQEFKTHTKVRIALQFVQLVLLVILTLAGLNVHIVLLLIAVIATLQAAAFGWIVFDRIWKRLPVPAAPGKVGREILGYGAPLFINAVGGFLYTYVDILFIHSWLTLQDTADYFFMYTLFELPLRALASYVFVLHTEVSRCAGEKDFGRIKKLFRRSVAGASLMGVLSAAAFFCIGVLIDKWFIRYAGAVPLIKTMAPLFIIKIVAQVASGAFLVSLGRAGLLAVLTVTSGLVNVVLDVLWIPSNGTLGAVYATLVGHGTMGVLTLILVVMYIHKMRSCDREEPDQ